MEKSEAKWATDLKDICDKLAPLGFTFVVMPYNGSGDEGFTEDAQYFTTEEEPEDDDNQGSDGSDVIPEKLSKAVANVLDDAICEQYPGWGDNEGSTGRMILDIKKKTLKFDHSWYTTETVSEDSEFEL